MRERLARTLTRLGEEPSLDPQDPNAQAVAYMDFGDALEAAGFARALGDDDAMRTHLARAARMGAAVFELAGTLEASITAVPSGEEMTFVDTSAANPWTYVRAVYAAAASDEDAAADTLAALDPERLESDQVTVSAPVALVAHTLRARLRDEGEAVDVPADHDGAGDGLWLAQLRALDAIAEKDGNRFAAEIERVVDAEQQSARRRGEASDPETLLHLPELGLRALAARAGVA